MTFGFGNQHSIQLSYGRVKIALYQSLFRHIIFFGKEPSMKLNTEDVSTHIDHAWSDLLPTL